MLNKQPSLQRSPGLWSVSLVLILSLAIAGGAWMTNVGQMQNFSEPDAPLYLGGEADASGPLDGELMVVTYNIRYGEDIEAAIEELQSPELPADVDVLLLQEMDLAGVRRIADALGMSFAFAPASVHTHHDQQFGNAVLSRWPIVDAEKIILPHNHPLTNQMRAATRATLDVGEFELPVYSVHTETIMTLPGHRQDQYDALASHVSATADYVIAGGDFNTVTAGQVGDLAGLMAEAGMQHASAGSGPTVARFNVPAQADHIFSKRFEIVDVGVIDGNASDHALLWVQLASRNELNP